MLCRLFKDGKVFLDGRLRHIRIAVMLIQLLYGLIVTACCSAFEPISRLLLIKILTLTRQVLVHCKLCACVALFRRRLIDFKRLFQTGALEVLNIGCVGKLLYRGGVLVLRRCLKPAYRRNGVKQSELFVFIDVVQLVLGNYIVCLRKLGHQIHKRHCGIFIQAVCGEELLRKG